MSGSPSKTKMPPRGFASSGKAVTPNDAVDLPDGPCFGVSVTTAGAYKVTFVDDADAAPVTVYCAAGYNPFGLKRIWATGSVSTSGITALYA